MNLIRRSVAFAALLAAFASPARAEPVVDQSQPAVDPAAGFLGVGGDAEQQLAQTFTVGLTGNLVGLRLPIAACGGGDLVIDIVELDSAGRPGASVRASASFSPADVPSTPPGTFIDFLFDPPLAVATGQRLAFTLRMSPETANCSLADAPAGDSYAGGDAYFDARPNPPGWALRRETDASFDLPFETLMDDLSPPGPPPMASRSCDLPPPASGGPGIDLPAFLPICRCLEDPGLREFRCALLHPDFFIVRRVPAPIPLDTSYVETWQFSPLTQLYAPVRLRIEGAGFARPLEIAFDAHTKPGAFQTRRLKAAAPSKPADLPGRASISYAGRNDPRLGNFAIDASLAEDRFATDAQGGDLRKLKEMKRPQ
ncbi:MAG: hypothetical protein Kow00133_10130 [Amphiplicatus sp.]